MISTLPRFSSVLPLKENLWKQIVERVSFEVLYSEVIRPSEVMMNIIDATKNQIREHMESEN